MGDVNKVHKKSCLSKLGLWGRDPLRGEKRGEVHREGRGYGGIMFLHKGKTGAMVASSSKRRPPLEKSDVLGKTHRPAGKGRQLKIGCKGTTEGEGQQVNLRLGKKV